MPSQPSKNLDTFPNPRLDRDYIIEIECPEFTCLCPKTGQPDFATLTLEYVPDRLCVELKSLKLYIWSYRNEGHFHEDVTNRILNDLVAVTHPRYLRLRAKFYVRGGLYTTVEVVHRQSGWQAPPPPPADLPREVQELPAKQVPGTAPAQAPAAKPMPAAKPRNPVKLTEPVIPPAPAPKNRNPAPAPEPEPSASERFRMLRRSRRNDPPPEPEPELEPEEIVAEPVEPEPPPPAPVRKDGLYIGIDLGTTGCRAIAVDATGKIHGEMSAPIPTPPRNGDEVTQDPTVWWKAVTGCLQNLLKQIDPQRVQAIAVDGTSGTLLLCDAKGSPVTPAIMYNDRRAVQQAKHIASLTSGVSGAQGAGSGLAKLMWMHDKKLDKRAQHALHQADWISGKLIGQYGHSDYNNCLKLGFDAEKMAWPKWLNKLGFDSALLPEVHVPGESLGTLSADIAKTFGLPSDVEVLAGTTDGVASFLAAGPTESGHGVTALGTTLVLKLLSDKPVFSLEHGVYSHRLGRYWLAGGASNSGGAVLLQYFKIEQMREMTPLLDPESVTGLDYYPLPDIGERFPINNPEMAPRLEPLPGNSITFFQGMLEGIARIEAEGYQLLGKLGAPALSKVFTTGGGSQNPAWTRIREKILRVKMEKPRSGHAAYGSALLAAGVVAKTFS
ncbi:preQ(1) synthase [Sulfuricaulis limicola]|uniref:preQ(1) synthase n=1 Tax=Sulfuricaulis limicola TaxID=1620215 RepID=UPI000BBAC27C|nr:preQ(1) synthase [Sulfuricaulis limicola]